VDKYCYKKSGAIYRLVSEAITITNNLEKEQTVVIFKRGDKVFVIEKEEFNEEFVKLIDEPADESSPSFGQKPKY